MRDWDPHPGSGGRVGPGDRRRDHDAPKSDYTEFGFRDPQGVDPLDAVLDGDLDRRSPEFRAAFVRDRGFRDRAAAMDSIIDQLKRVPKGPDFTASILDAVDARKPFLAAPRRRALSASRVATAASLLALFGGFALLDRLRPGVLDTTTSPAPVTHAVGRAAEVGGEIRENLSPASFAAVGAVLIRDIVASQPAVARVELHVARPSETVAISSPEPRQDFARIIPDDEPFVALDSTQAPPRPLGNAGSITISYAGACVPESSRPASSRPRPTAATPSSAVVRPLGAWAGTSWANSSVRQSSATWARGEYSLLPYRSEGGSR